MLAGLYYVLGVLIWHIHTSGCDRARDLEGDRGVCQLQHADGLRQRAPLQCLAINR